ncbi:hypothetical protein ACFQJ7_11585 [Halovenus rubra]|uniref:Uncharacterized protein n=2 Tax=Halovenus rubra TaxID=869890 RepID=A0ACC7E4G1_9EURY|nr:hypothetical protein [Halovenus rubra]
MVECNGVAIYRCIKEDDELVSLAVLDSSEIEKDENETVKQVSQSLIEDLIDDSSIGSRRSTPDYGDSKSARIHEYKDSVEAERENGLVTKDVLEELRESTNLEQNSRALAEWYLEETQSRSDLILVIPYTYDRENFVGIIKTPYLDDAYQTDPSDILREAQRVIQEETHKGIIHPRYDHSVGEVYSGEAKVYQSGGGPRYADYWIGFINLAETKVEDEELVESVADGSGPVAAVQSSSEFSDLPDRVDDEGLLDGRLNIEISGISLDVDVGDLADERVRLAEKDGTYFVIFTGGDLDVEASDGSTSQELPELSEFEDLTEALSDYL